MGAQDLTTAATVAGDLGVDPADAALARIVVAASKAVVRHLNRGSIEYATGLIERVRGYGRPWLSLSRRPVLSIASIALSGAPYDSTDYLIDDANAGLVIRVGGVWPQTGLVRGGIVQEELALATADGQGLVATYDGGWVTPGQAGTAGWSGPARTLPEDIEEAVIQIVSTLYRGRGADPNIISESLGDASITYHQVRKAMPDSALALLEPYVQVLP
jgi:hypothetical protein